MATVEIHDKYESGEGRFPAFDLAEILPCIALARENLKWALLEMRAIAAGRSFDVSLLERRAAASSHGMDLTWTELVSLGERVFQLIDGIIVGYVSPRPSSSDADLRQSCEVIIEAFNSSHWRVYATDESVITCLGSRFNDVRHLDEIELIAGTHRSGAP